MLNELEEFRAYTDRAFPDWKKNPYSKTLPRLKQLALHLVAQKRWRLIRALFNLKG